MGNLMSDTSQVLVRKAAVDEAALVGEILGDAFDGDPVGRWFSGDPGFSAWFWSVLTPLMSQFAEMYIAGDGQGAAIWVPPNAEMKIRPPLGVAWAFWRRFGIGAILRFVRVMTMTEKYHPEDEHYYLLGVGVRPESKGGGIGSALLEPVLQECDRSKVVAYLENSDPRNLPFYRRHGFEVREEVTLPGNGPKLFMMYREPAQGGVEVDYPRTPSSR